MKVPSQPLQFKTADRDGGKVQQFRHDIYKQGLVP